jgi:hypothetical protein
MLEAELRGVRVFVGEFKARLQERCANEMGKRRLILRAVAQPKKEREHHGSDRELVVAKPTDSLRPAERRW